MKLSRLAFATVFACNFIMAIGHQGLMSVLPGVGRTMGLPDALISAAFGTSSLCIVLMSAFWARTSDRLGRKPVMLVGLGGFTVSMVLCAAVVAAGTHKLAPWFIIAPCLIAARSVFGLVGSAIMPSSQAFVTERTPRDDRAKAIAGLAGAGSMGTIIGPVLAPFLILPFVGFSGPMLIFAVLSAGAAVLVAANLREGPRLEEEPAFVAGGASAAALAKTPFWKDGRIMPFVVVGIATGVGQGALGQMLPFLIIDTVKGDLMEAQHSIAIALMIGAVAGLTGQWGLIRIFRMKPNHLILWGGGIALLGALVLLAASQFTMIVAGFAICCVGFSFVRPGYTAGMSLAVSLGEQGRVAGIAGAVGGALNIMSPLFVGLYQLSHNLPFAVTAALIGAGFVYSLFKPALRTAGLTPRPASAPAAG
ncbi:MFS transporter [Phenylobacterium immobile]|uniref:MFS transporter n=1 Tax=Phenylobacterium immobile TaxID=21 RepID=UPI000A6CC19A|nr:MFS transporter [Phenylobacterium immobile]